MLQLTSAQFEALAEDRVTQFKKKVRLALSSECDDFDALPLDEVVLFIEQEYTVATDEFHLRSEREIYVYILSVAILGRNYWANHPEEERLIKRLDQPWQRKDFLLDLIKAHTARSSENSCAF